jgi:hypothetical protein
LVSTEFAACGAVVHYAGTGRRPRYCSAGCRQHGWALRHAAAELGREDPRPSVNREVIAREHVATVRVSGKAPMSVTRLLGLVEISDADTPGRLEWLSWC